MMFSFETRRLFLNSGESFHSQETTENPSVQTEQTPEQKADFAVDFRGEMQDRQTSLPQKFKDQCSFRCGSFDQRLLGAETSQEFFARLLQPNVQSILKEELNRYEKPELQILYEQTQDQFLDFLKNTKLNPEQQMAGWRKIKPIFNRFAEKSGDSTVQAKALQQGAQLLESLKNPVANSAVTASDWGGIDEDELTSEVLDVIYQGDTGNTLVNQRGDQILAGNGRKYLGHTPAKEALRVALTEYEQQNPKDAQRLFGAFGIKPVDLLKAPPEFQQFLNNTEHHVNSAIDSANTFAKTHYLNETVKALQNGEPLSDKQKLALAVPNGIGAILKLPISLPVAISKIKPLLDKMTVSEQRDEMFGQIGNAVEKYWANSTDIEKVALITELGTEFAFFGWIVKSLKTPETVNEMAQVAYQNLPPENALHVQKYLARTLPANDNIPPNIAQPMVVGSDVVMQATKGGDIEKGLSRGNIEAVGQARKSETFKEALSPEAKAKTEWKEFVNQIEEFEAYFNNPQLLQIYLEKISLEDFNTLIIKYVEGLATMAKRTNKLSKSAELQSQFRNKEMAVQSVLDAVSILESSMKTLKNAIVATKRPDFRVPPESMPQIKEAQEYLKQIVQRHSKP